MADIKIKKVTRGLECCLAVKNAGTQTCFDCPYRELDGKENVSCEDWLMDDALELLRPLVEAKIPENLRERRAGRTRVHLGDCPVCHRVVQFAQRHCHNCVQLLDWTEVLEMPCEDEDSPET